MKSPEDIKKGLECCFPSEDPDCFECPYRAMDNCFNARINDILAYIQQLEVAVPKWISVEERLPGDPLDGDGEVVELLIKKHGTVLEVLPGYYDYRAKDWVVYRGDFSGEYLHDQPGWWDVIKWRQMPEPPKEEVHG